ncbi:MAG: DNA processing protein DprA [Candidatus Dojkabacteria bacterium]|nr:MAG: DNA processing protein DprA [Candidatus Dojkabacteria bacterium]
MRKRASFVNYLLSHNGVGNMTVVKLFRLFPDFNDLVNNFEKNEKIPNDIKKIIFKALSQEKEEEDNIITIWDAVYPNLLKQIYDPPVRLFYKGNLDFLNNVGISIVGTRKSSAYGKKVTQKLIEFLEGYPVFTVSGMALGIDSFVHYESLKRNIKTVAILGSGIDNITPKSNQALFDEIVHKENLVLSEYPNDTNVVPGMFASRNRIIAGMSKVTVIVEAGQKSGALITARLALDNNRDVFAVPGNIFSEMSNGTNMLITQGEACLLHNFNQILEALNLKKISTSKSNRPKLRQDLEELLDIFQKNNMLTPDEVGKITQKNNYLSLLGELELLGLIERVGGAYTLS